MPSLWKLKNKWESTLTRQACQSRGTDFEILSRIRGTTLREALSSTQHSTGPARKAVQAAEFNRWTSDDISAPT
jgi:hypothetical protein